MRRLPGWLSLLLRTRLAWVGLLIVLVMVFLAFSADVLTPFDPNEQRYAFVLQPPSPDFPLGTDDIGRDVYSRIVYGTRVSLEVGLLAVGISTATGTLIGLSAGYYGGWLEDVLMRTMDALRAFPGLVLALSINAVLGPGIGNVMIAIGVVSTPTFARLAHGQTLSVREREYVKAARVAGAGPWRMMLRHILPNIAAPIIVQASLAAAFAILAEAGLSFLGLGVRPPTPSWGSMLRTGQQYLNVAPWLSLFPGIAIFLAVLGFNLLGDGLREALDPRLQPRRGRMP
ncbi:MAG TPA: ABC transporter permease [Chloroflexota bacterium]|nr:ABC transporter permease [Chloroflexota bacterium]